MASMKAYYQYLSDNPGLDQTGENSKIIYVSTPKGLNHFYEIHEAIKSGQARDNILADWWNDDI